MTRTKAYYEDTITILENAIKEKKIQMMQYQSDIDNIQQSINMIQSAIRAEETTIHSSHST
jgi:hypothetical protein